jgi:hypothetical protein
LNHFEAKAVVDGLGLGLSPAESLFARMIAFFETNYGQGWKEGEGKGSNNWGAITIKRRSEPSDDCVGAFAHKDSRFDDELGRVVEYVTCFKEYPTPEEGAADVVRVALRSNVRAALPSLRAAVAGMHANGYFTGTKPTAAENVDAYSAALTRALVSIRKATGEPDPFVIAGEPPDSDALSPGSESWASRDLSSPVSQPEPSGAQKKGES